MNPLTRAVPPWVRVVAGAARGRLGALAPWVLTVALAALWTGCRHGPPDAGGGPPGLADDFEVRLPEFLTGPAGVLLTNTAGFSARLTFTRANMTAPGVPPMRGLLLAREGWLLFQPESGGARGGKARGWSLLYSVDVLHGKGTVASEALQGYAPFTMAPRYTIRATNELAGGAEPKALDGHTCRGEQVVVSSSEGATVSFQVWRAPDLNGLPLRIVSQQGGETFSVDLTEVLLEYPKRELFQPPPGFTKYDSVEAMMSELPLRQRELRPKTRRPVQDADELGPPPGMRG